jgi:hypothetical protein
MPILINKDSFRFNLVIDSTPEIICKENQCGLHLEGRFFIKIAKKVVKADKSILAIIN